MDAGQAAARAAPLVRRHGPADAVAGPPLPVLRPDGATESWLVPVASGDRLAGWVRVRRSGAAYSALGPPWPALAAWTDPAAVLAAAAAAGHDPTGEPYLGYDGVPDRLAWAVPVADGVAYVAGHAVWVRDRV